MALGRVPCHLRRWQRHVFFAGGPVSKNVPLLMHANGRRLTRLLRERLERWGYQVEVLTPRSNHNG
jgi:hypothetical protein